MVDHIRPATHADYDAVNAVFAEIELLHRMALPYMYRAPAGPALGREFFEAQLADEAAIWLVAEQAGEVVGFLHMRAKQTAEQGVVVARRYAHIESLAVRASSQRAGLGRAMMAAAADWAAARGLAEIELNMWEFNQGALRFYQQLGYVTERRTLRRVMSDVNS